MNWLIGAVLAGVIAGLARQVRFLTSGGAIGAFLMGWLIFSLGGVPFSIPVLLFFVSSSLLTRKGNADRFQKSRNRDLKQVLANGFAATVLLLCWHVWRDPMWIILFLTALASATSDTWATEIGMRSNATPRSILSLQHVQKGTSGGITSAGMFAAFIGAFFIALTGWLIFKDYFANSWGQTAIISISGVTAQTVDSLLGATVQARYRCQLCQQRTEVKWHCGTQTEPYSGYLCIDNDVVNFVAIAFGIMLAWSLLVVGELM